MAATLLLEGEGDTSDGLPGGGCIQRTTCHSDTRWPQTGRRQLLSESQLHLCMSSNHLLNPRLPALVLPRPPRQSRCSIRQSRGSRFRATA